MTNKYLTGAARLIACLLALIILLGAGAGSVTRAYAADETNETNEPNEPEQQQRTPLYEPDDSPVDLDKKCELTVYPCGSEQSFRQDVESAEMTVDLYKIASAAEIPGIDSYDYTLLSPFNTDALAAQLAKARKVAQNVNNRDEWDKFAQQVAAVIKESTDVSYDFTRTKAKNAGSVLFNDDAFLPGLYLIVPHTDAANYWKELDGETEGSKVLVSTTYSDSYYYYYQPLLVSMPHKREAVPTSEALPTPVIPDPAMTSDEGGWYYGLEVFLKPTQEPRSADLWIRKTLVDYHVASDAIFSFQVDAVRDGKTIYSKAFSVLFESGKITYYTDDYYPGSGYADYPANSNGVNGVKFTVAKDVPIGSTVTVTESYQGSSCVPVNDAYFKVVYTGTMTKDGLQIAENTVLQPVPFVNKGNGSNGGGGLENTFTVISSATGGNSGTWDNGSGNDHPGVDSMPSDTQQGS